MARDYSKTKRVKRRTVRISDHSIDSEIRSILTMYCADVTEAVDKAGETMVRDLVRITRNTAPAKSGQFRKAIASKTIERPSGNLYVWYVKSPQHRITHLLVHGHAKANGGRVNGDPFLHNALEEVLPEYEAKVKEAVRNG